MQKPKLRDSFFTPDVVHFMAHHPNPTVPLVTLTEVFSV